MSEIEILTDRQYRLLDNVVGKTLAHGGNRVMIRCCRPSAALAIRLYMRRQHPEIQCDVYVKRSAES